MKDENLYLIQILECIQRIESYTVDGRDAFTGRQNARRRHSEF